MDSNASKSIDLLTMGKYNFLIWAAYGELIYVY